MLAHFAPLIALGIVGVVVGGVLLIRHIDREREYYSAFDKEHSTCGADIG
jgi:hypothetical protein